MSDYVVDGQTYTFPDTYSDRQARDILVRHGVIKLQGGGGAPPGPAKPPTQMETTTAGKVLPAVQSFAAGSLKGIANLPSAIASTIPHTETLPPIPASVQPWHPSTYGAYQPPNPQTGLQQGVAAFSQDPAGTIGQMVPLAAMGVNAGIPPVGEAPPPSPTTGISNLPELGTIGKLASHIPGVGRFIKAYDIIRGMLPGEPTAQAPTPFKPNPNIARRMKFGGSTSPNFSAPSGPIKTGKVTGGAAPPIEPIGSKAPVTVPSETLPSRDWRFEDARDMARLLNQHGIDPTDMGDEEWNIAAPALKRNLGVPNDNAKNMVLQEWNKLRGAQ